PFPYVYTPSAARFSLPMGLFTVPARTVSNPYVHHLSFTVEKALPSNLVVNAGYARKLRHNLLRMNQINPERYIPGQSTIANTESRRLYLPGIFGSIREVAGNSNSTFHSLQLFVNRRLSRGFTVTGSYTFSKYLDYYSATNLGQFPQDPFNMRADRSRSDEDRTHIFNSSFYYEVPGRRGLLGRTLGSWNLFGSVTMISGPPLHIRSGVDNSLTGVGWDRPDLSGVPYRDHPSRDDFINSFFNTAAFAANAPGRFGNFGRNVFSGPASATTNLAIVKSFPISERFGKVQFRSEFFNLWNSVNFG